MKPLKAQGRAQPATTRRAARTPPPRPAPAADENSTAQRLLGTAAALFRQKGYQATTTREIAGLVGINSASIYYHVTKKEDLLYSLCMDALQDIRRLLDEASARYADPMQRLRAIVREYLKVAVADQDKLVTMLFELRSLADERRREVIRYRDQNQDIVRATVAAAQKAGQIRNDMSAQLLTLAFLNMHNWSIFWYRPDGDLSPAQLGDLLATLLFEGAARPSR
jgi:AcrR family transcriptional regulator